MQSLRRVAVQQLAAFRRGMATAAEPSAEAQWAAYFTKPKPVSAETSKKNMRKEMAGFLLLGPASAAFMMYDIFVGLEEEHEVRATT